MTGVTVAEVAGIIALATAVVAFVGPNLIALLIASRVGRKRPAVVWSVVGREMQSSSWPVLLRTDTAASSGMPWSIAVLCWLQKLALIFVTVAGIVTPLGLRSEIRMNSTPEPVIFRPVTDTGPIGKGTPARDPDAFFNRICKRPWDHGLDAVPVACAFSDMEGDFSITTNATSITFGWNGTYDIRIPHRTAEIFSSVHDEHPQSVSGAFDMQWRQYTYQTRGKSVNHGQPFQVGAYRPVDTLLLNDVVEPVAGLIVDTRHGGIAFRDHTAPTDVSLGGEWSEDLLFVTPQTVCVDTNVRIPLK